MISDRTAVVLAYFLPTCQVP